jgi:galactofuranose transport system ATP-binding protein
VLILDEPTASLDRHEVEILFGILRQLAGRGIGIVFVSHFLDQVYEISDRITVLRNGRLVGERETASLSRLELIRMMLGRELAETTSARASAGAQKTREVCASFENYGKAGYVAPFNLELRHGEVVGLAGLLGSGRTETARLVFGAERADFGQARVEGAAVRLQSPRDGVRHGFGYCPEERKTEGIVAELTVRENIVLALQAKRGLHRPLSRREQDEIAGRYVKMLDIRPPDPERPVGLLSGGNQQKVLLARWLATSPRLLVLDEPTRGIDVGAHAEIIRLIRELCDDGLALLVISSELDEVVTYSDRVVVLRDRAHVEELAGEAIDVGSILAAIAADGASVAHEGRA